MRPGTASNNSPGRTSGRYGSSAAPTLPWEAECAMPTWESLRPVTTISGSRAASSSLISGPLALAVDDTGAAIVVVLTRQASAKGNARAVRNPAPCNNNVASRKPAPNITRLAAPGNSWPWAKPWKKAKNPTSDIMVSGCKRVRLTTSAANTSTDAVITHSTPGSSAPLNPTRPPSAITATKVTGSRQRMAPRCCDAHQPTASIASR